MTLPEFLRPYAIRWMLVGSRMTCRPPPTDTDQDVLVLVRPDTGPEVVAAAEQAGLAEDGSGQLTAERFWSIKDGEMNYLIVDQPELWHSFLAATSVARRLNLLDKADRIALFEAVQFRRYPEETHDYAVGEVTWSVQPRA